MSERTVRERIHGRPLTQRLTALETQQRSILLRSNPGALRTATVEEVVSPTNPANSFQIVSVNVTAGRWNCLARGTLVKVFTGDEHFVVTIGVVDPVTGMPPLFTAKNLLPQVWQLGLTGIVSLPFCLFGDFTSEEDEVTVSLVAVETATEGAYTVRDAQLTLIPA